MVKDKAAIMQSISNLLLTNKGERLFQPQLGSGLQTALFEPMDFGTAAIIKNEVRECLSKYEPRIRVNVVRCDIDYQNNGYEVEVDFTIVGRNDKPQSISIFLERTR